jgi:hypothetical protein
VVPAAVEAGIADSKGQFAALFADGLGTTTLLIWGCFWPGCWRPTPASTGCPCC